MGTVALLLGSNLGEREENLQKALLLIDKEVGPIRKQSALYQTAPWGNPDQDDFLNQAILVDTEWPVNEVLIRILAIETQLGRERREKWGPRTIDIDILYYDQEMIDNEDLKIPHPYMQDRRFSLIPLQEICPEWIHPILHKTVNQMLADCTDRGEVTLFTSSDI